jgi:hypothetical protein
MVHLGHFRSCCTLLYQIAVSIRNDIRLMALDQQLGPLGKNRARRRTWTRFWVDFVGWTRSPISSRASQNAAALLFDLGTVDVR